MRAFIKFCVYCCACICLTITTIQAEPYRLIAGSSALGLRENEKQNVNVGFSRVFNELLSSENVKCEFKSLETSEELYAAIQAKQVNAFFGSPIEFLKTEQYLLSSPIVSGIFVGNLKAKIYLVVRKDSQINALSQLKGKKLASQKLISGDLGGVYLETVLLENKLGLPTQFFSEIQKADTSNRALVDLFFKKADAALISQNQFEIATELNPQLLAQTQILVASEPYLIFVAALSKNTPSQVIDPIKKSLLAMNKSAKGKSVLNLMKMQGFQEVAIDELDNVSALVAKNSRLKAEQHVH